MVCKIACFLVAFLGLAPLIIGFSGEATAWSNGGYSSYPANLGYGTHDWIAQHALDWLSASEQQFFNGDLSSYLYGTELPDNGTEPGGVGDTTLHHVYFRADGSLQDNASAARASQEYANAQASIAGGNGSAALMHLGMVAHYVADLAVFGHVMGATTQWGAEEHHSDYESYVLTRTDAYDELGFEDYLHFDGELSNTSAYDTALTVAFDTTFGDTSGLNCTWMDAHYNWSSAEFKNRAGQSLNLAVNSVADIMHTFYSESFASISSASPIPQPTAAIPEFSIGLVFVILCLALSVVAALNKKKILWKHLN